MGILALGILITSSAGTQASEILVVRMEIPNTVYSGNLFTVHVNLSNNMDKPVTMKRWFVVLGFKDLTIQGPFGIGAGPSGIINPGNATSFSFNFHIECPHRLRNTMVPFTIFVEGERSLQFGQNYIPVTEIVGGHMRMITVQ